jgi:phosphinothricin acetyltransferase
MDAITIRTAQSEDVASILRIYNQGIEDRIATLESEPKDLEYMKAWWQDHQARYKVLVAETDGQVVGWASLNPYSHRCAYSGVADLSIYVERSYRGKGIGRSLLQALETEARAQQFTKIVLFTFPFNTLGQGLYRKMGYREVGIYEKHGRLDGRFVDIMAMEKVLVGTASTKGGIHNE